MKAIEGTVITNKEKQSLFKDLCARLAYGVKCQLFDNKTPYTLLGVDENVLHIDCPVYGEGDDYVDIEYCKPYLRPMSSMTEEEKNEFISYANYDVEESVNGRHYEYYLKDFVGTPETPICNRYAIDWILEHHFDYRGLIEKGLALEAPKGMYNFTL